MAKVIYTGFFINHEYLEGRGTLEKTIASPHVTHKFRPSEVNTSLMGEEIIVKAVGYGIDNENEGYKVAFVNGSQRAEKSFKEVAVPHITISISAEGKAVNTRYLNFDAIDGPQFKAIYGAYTTDGKVVYDLNIIN